MLAATEKNKAEREIMSVGRGVATVNCVVQESLSGKDHQAWPEVSEGLSSREKSRLRQKFACCFLGTTVATAGE